ncbi:MAG: hypothetical protein EXS67_06555 [Candidatus Margulisbacteria bacterium]|nr:hypothetical protein [Candidatus Margulisiibacteriota bacterium]
MENEKCGVSFENMVLIHYLLNDYATLLEYLIGIYPKKVNPIFDEAHLVLFRNKLGLVNKVVDGVDGWV